MSVADCIGTPLNDAILNFGPVGNGQLFPLASLSLASGGPNFWILNDPEGSGVISAMYNGTLLGSASFTTVAGKSTYV